MWISFIITILFTRKQMIFLDFRLVHLDGSLVDISMVKPTLNSSVNEEEVEERIDLEKEEEHLKQMDEEEISEPHVISESYTCQMMPDPVPDQGSGRSDLQI